MGSSEIVDGRDTPGHDDNSLYAGAAGRVPELGGAAYQRSTSATERL
jgi:hypothetical protein